ncbi:right-handed parallel beta-helix repeat-containing protein [Jannaschia sp. M317]|uniref:right-handed parallel beta-helix repeat-containing protein n=1 Tax=Jannaschia sp. M317 TaxID=2867011 RepID=UPI0021A69F0C|nr:right-handed parallel beta-helix repeat-containing protein [Jannaschia sp. M317]UWQ17942.1 right-handed parallel beta-helix repeat-containing protein [Jannaschia sp. M317]
MIRRLTPFLAALFLAFSPASGATPVGRALDASDANYATLRAEVSALRAPQEQADTGTPTGSVLEPVDLRIALFQVARDGEAEHQATALNAQPGGRTEALTLHSGTATLTDLQSVPEYGDNGLTRPLIIGVGATLRLTEGQILRLDRAAGAFVINFGTLDITGGGIVSAGGPNLLEPAFAPFVLTGGAGSFAARDAWFEGLGIARSLSFGGLAVAGQGLYRAPSAPRIVNSVLRDVATLAFLSGTEVEVTGTTFDRSRGSAIVLRGVTGARLRDNTILDTIKGDGIRLHRSPDSRITGTRIFRAHASGIVLESGSHGSRVSDSVIWRAGHQGVHAEASDCVTLTDLAILAPRRDGILLRAAQGARVTGSRIMDAGRAGLLIAGQAETARTQLSGNTLAFNRTGIETAAPGRLRLSGNDFTDQFPRFLSGDVQAQTPALLRDLTGAAPIVLAAGGVPDAPPPIQPCPSES